MITLGMNGTDMRKENEGEREGRTREKKLQLRERESVEVCSLLLHFFRLFYGPSFFLESGDPFVRFFFPSFSFLTCLGSFCLK